MKRFTTALVLGLTLHTFTFAATEAGQPAAAETREPDHLTSPFNFANRTVRLNDGRDMPIIGLGVYTLSDADTYNAVFTALKSGYRLIDTASLYGNEGAVGRAVHKSGVPRKQIFVTTKLWPDDFARADAEIDNMLKRLDIGYIDLLLLHHPADNDKEAYKAMERAVKAGKVKSIGLSNYNEKEVKEIINIATIKPAVVQNETHPFNQNQELKNYLDQYGIVLEAWYPLGGREREGRSGQKEIFEHPSIRQLAKKHSKTPAQIVLRWQLQAGNIAIPSSRNAAHIKENVNIFNFELNPEDMRLIGEMDKKRRFSDF